MGPDANIQEQIALVNRIRPLRNAGQSSYQEGARYDELRAAYSRHVHLGGLSACASLLGRLAEVRELRNDDLRGRP